MSIPLSATEPRLLFHIEEEDSSDRVATISHSTAGLELYLITAAGVLHAFTEDGDEIEEYTGTPPAYQQPTTAGDIVLRSLGNGYYEAHVHADLLASLDLAKGQSYVEIGGVVPDAVIVGRQYSLAELIAVGEGGRVRLSDRREKHTQVSTETGEAVVDIEEVEP